MAITRRVPRENYEKVDEIVITIENPNEHIQVSKSRRAKYFDTRKDKIPKKYYDKKNYIWKDDTILDITTRKKAIKNPQIAGTPKLFK